MGSFFDRPGGTRSEEQEGYERDRNFCRADRLRLATLFQSIEETRYYLNGVYIEAMDDGVRLRAMDGHRLAVFRDEAAFTCAPCIVALQKPRAAIKSVKAPRVPWFGIIGQHDGIGRHEARVVDGSEGMASMEEIRPPCWT